MTWHRIKTKFTSASVYVSGWIEPYSVSQTGKDWYPSEPYPASHRSSSQLGGNWRPHAERDDPGADDTGRPSVNRKQTCWADPPGSSPRATRDRLATEQGP